MKRNMTLKRKWLAAMLVAAALMFGVGQQAMAQTKQAVVVGSSGNVTAVKDGTADAVSTSDKTYVETTSGNTVTLTTAAPEAGKVAKVTVRSYTVTSASEAKVPVTALTVTGMGEATVVSKGSTLQMTATAAPTYADWQDVTVTWSITSGSDYASINTSTGVLTGTAEGDVVVTATATDGSGVTGQCTVTVVKPVPAGAIRGEFTINAGGEQVYFSQGNLQAVFASAGSSCTWKFAEHQWDCVGNNAANNSINGNGSVSAAGTVDLFGWVGASSTNLTTAPAKYGISNSISFSESLSDNDYGAATNENLMSDWGTLIGTGWRTLTKAEWEYLLYTRTVNEGTGAGKCYTYGQTVNNMLGLVIYPDGYTGSEYAGSDWATFEAAGCVFLPAAGYRWQTTSTIDMVGTCIYYWTATSSESVKYQAYRLTFDNYNTTGNMQAPMRNRGYAVRLVKDVE